MLGTITQLNPRGFGYIHPLEPGKPRVWFHARQLVGIRFDDEPIGMKVEFEIKVAPRGPEAINVRPAA